ncbi:MAG TPA: fibronectin type III domain-containing protein, partial [Acidimicrobiales bacterium]|nr:fibronectin type III domain-containing protein [Acidimicrobiales bacterium]
GSIVEALAVDRGSAALARLRAATTWVATTKGSAVAAVMVAALVLQPTTAVRPTAPRDFAADPALSAVEVSWRLPAEAGSGRLRGIRLYRDGSAIANLGPATTSYVDTKVQPGALHSYRVAAFNRVGEGGRSKAIRAARLSVPGMPTALSHDPVSVPGGVVLLWAPPESDGGSLVTGYAIFRDDVEIATTEGRVTTYTDENLLGSQDYIYEVAARNDVGPGVRSAPLVARVAPHPLTLRISSRDLEPVRSTSPLIGGVAYVVEVAGAYTYGRGEADAECSTAGTDFQFKANRYGYRSKGDPLDLVIGGVAVKWEPSVPTSEGCSVDHVYRYRLRPRATGLLEMSVFDLNYSDNRGALLVTVYPQG